MKNSLPNNSRGLGKPIEQELHLVILVQHLWAERTHDEAAARKAFSLAKQHGREGWHDFDSYTDWIEKFHGLIMMLDSIR